MTSAGKMHKESLSLSVLQDIFSAFDNIDHAILLDDLPKLGLEALYCSGVGPFCQKGGVRGALF